MKYEVIDVPQNDPCNKCIPCTRMKLMELGFIEGQEIQIREKMKGMFIIDMLSDSGFIEQSIALRKDELDRICYKLK